MSALHQPQKQRQRHPLLSLSSMLLITAFSSIERSFSFVIRSSSLTTASFVARQGGYERSYESSIQSRLYPTNSHSMMTMMANGGGGDESLSSLLDGRNLVSIKDCIKASKMTGEEGDGGGDVVFVDGSWYHKGGRNGREEFKNGPRIKGARHIDMDDIATTKELFPELNPKGLPHMLPPKELFAAAMDALSIKNSDHVVIYGKEGCVFTPRTWFLFRSLGHDPFKVHLMQGSLEDYIAEGGDVDHEPTDDILEAKDLDLNGEFMYQARDAAYVVDMDGVKQAVDEQEVNFSSSPLILDPRGSAFPKGHIPEAIHVPYASIHTPDDTLKIKSIEELKQIFQDAGVDVQTDRTIMCSCGSGVSVCHLVLALEECGRDVTDGKTLIYDGSWAEWGSDPDTPKVAED